MSIRNTDYLTIRLSALGDAILTTGVLEYWHKARGLRAHVLTRQSLAPVFENHPAVAEIIPVTDEQLGSRAWIENCWHLSRSHGTMPLIDLHGTLRSRMLRLLWPGMTYAYPKLSLARRLYLTSRLPYFSRQLLRCNVPQRYSLALETRVPAAASLRPVLFLNENERTAGKGLLEEAGISRPIAIHPYATHPAKTPQADIWRNCVTLLRNQGKHVIIIGRNITPLLPDDPADLTNRTDLRLTAAVLSQCECLISGDSGPMHLGTAVGTPVGAIFGPTTPEWGFYPSGSHDRVLQIACTDAPCSLHGQDACSKQNACMTSVTPHQIAKLIEQLSSLPRSFS